MSVEVADKADGNKKCNQCDFASDSASNLKRHLKTHTGKKSNIFATNQNVENVR